ncbi:MAG: ABC transporter ATP-binding protein [Wenzhouxiangellaceae bacterium]
MSRHAIVDVRALRHRYGKVQALTDLNLALERGRVTALLGPNGAGKTTLIHLILGLEKLQHGAIRLFDSETPGTGASRKRIGVMLQASGVQDNLTVAELLRLFGSFYPNPVPPERLVEETRLNGLESRRFKSLSGGQQQRVLFALATVGDPELLILDEPTTGLDPAARRGLWTAIEARRASGCSILLCTHYLDEAQRLADRVVLLHQGRVLADGHPDQVRARVARDRIRVRTALQASALRALPGVDRILPGADRTELTTRDATATVRALLQADPEADRLEVAPTDLETAFIELTEEAA